jgi:acyl-CoA reductase-like NAD-dependent aldehyde dehydrogenase
MGPPRFGMHVGGQVVAAAGGRWFETVDPFTGEVWAEVAQGDAGDVDRAVAAAHAAFVDGPWPELTATARGRLIHRLGDLVLDHLDDLVAAESRDNGKSHGELRTALRTMAGWYHYYGGLADKVQGDVIPVDRPDALNYTLREPYGVVAAILPWNSPLRLASWKLAPALAAGNTVVVKPSEHTSTSILRLMELLAGAGVPAGVVNVVTGFGPDVVPRLVEHPLVRMVSFTGGAVAGAVVAELAARAGKPATLELGGKSPHVVFADADLQRAARGVAAGVFSSGGQTCLAGSRLIVDRSVHDDLVDRVVGIAEKIRFGDPADPGTEVGPVATQAQFDRILGFIDRARAGGARLVAGGHAVEAAGCPRFVAPTVFTDVEPASELFQEEVFGPVLAVTAFDTEAEALTLANGVSYGLAAGVWTGDVGRAHRVSRRLQAGTVWVNGYRNTAPQSPFGGYKASGLGRESGVDAIHEYLQTKSVWIDLGEA